MQKIGTVLLLILVLLCTNSCKLASIGYSMTGGTLSPEVKTFSVDYFANKSLLVVPYLSELMTEKLKKNLLSKTKLQEVTDNMGDIRFEGEITNYRQSPINIQSDEVATSNRLTIEIRVKFTNMIEDKYDFDTKFSNYADYSIDQDFDSIEQSLIEDILDKIIDDIYNKALVNW